MSQRHKVDSALTAQLGVVSSVVLSEAADPDNCGPDWFPFSALLLVCLIHPVCLNRILNSVILIILR